LSSIRLRPPHFSAESFPLNGLPAYFVLTFSFWSCRVLARSSCVFFRDSTSSSAVNSSHRNVPRMQQIALAVFSSRFFLLDVGRRPEKTSTSLNSRSSVLVRASVLERLVNLMWWRCAILQPVFPRVLFLLRNASPFPAMLRPDHTDIRTPPSGGVGLLSLSLFIHSLLPSL